MLELRHLVTVSSGQFQVESGNLVSLGPQFILGKCKLNSFIRSSWRSYFVLSSICEFSVGNVRTVPSLLLPSLLYFFPFSLNSRKHFRAIASKTIELTLPTTSVTVSMPNGL
jgi:hypothetical protein